MIDIYAPLRNLPERRAPSLAGDELWALSSDLDLDRRNMSSWSRVRQGVANVSGHFLAQLSAPEVRILQPKWNSLYTRFKSRSQKHKGKEHMEAQTRDTLFMLSGSRWELLPFFSCPPYWFPYMYRCMTAIRHCADPDEVQKSYHYTFVCRNTGRSLKHKNKLVGCRASPLKKAVKMSAYIWMRAFEKLKKKWISPFGQTQKKWI